MLAGLTHALQNTHPRGMPSGHQTGPALLQQSAQNATVTPSLIVAITTQRKTRLVRQRRQGIQGLQAPARAQLFQESPLKLPPALGVHFLRHPPGLLHQRLAG
ncbi:MAG: hypothetical protein RIT26_1704 [Pseudomonadota bacterium]